VATFIEKRGITAKAVVAIVLLLAVLTGCKKQTEPEEPSASLSAETEITTAAPSPAG